MSPAPFELDTRDAPEVSLETEHPDRTLQIWNTVTQSLCISLTTIFFVLRMYCRIRIQDKVGREDWTCLAAWLGGIGYNVTALLMGYYGGGLHRWELSENSIITINKTTYGTMALYGPTAFVTKASILLILVRVFQPFKPLVRFIYVFSGIIAAYYIPVAFLKIFICVPVSKFWDKDKEGTCINQYPMITADAFISVLSDITILILPIIGTRPLQMPSKKKVRVIGILGAGGVACASSIIRLVLIMRNAQSDDSSYMFMRINLWGNAEISIGIICACLPFITPLVKKAHHEFSVKKTSNREYAMDSLHVLSRHATSHARSHISSAAAASEIEDLVPHAQAQGKIETTIRADAVDAFHEQQPQYEGQGIMKTIDVSRTVSSCQV